MGKVKAFDDVYSWLHFAYAFLVAFLEPMLAVAASVIFYAYQKFEREKWEVKRGDFVEWLVGLLWGAVAHKCVEVCVGVW